MEMRRSGFLHCHFAAPVLLLYAAAAQEDQSAFVRHEVVTVPLANRTLEFDVQGSWMLGPLLPAVAVSVVMAVTCAGMCFWLSLQLKEKYDAAKHHAGCALAVPGVLSGVPCGGDLPQGDDELKSFLSGEAALVVLAPWFAALAVSSVRWALGVGWSALLQPLLAAALVLRACAVDRLFWAKAKKASRIGDYAPVDGESCGQSCSRRWGLLRKYSGLALKFALSKLEILDGVSDGLAMAVAFRADAETRLRWANSFAAPDVVRGALASCGPGFALAAVLAYATVIQYPLRHDKNKTYPSLTAGLGLAVEAYRDENSYHVYVGMTSALGRTLTEAAPQLLLQTALLAAEGTGLADQPVVGFSVGLSVVMLLKSTVELTLDGLKAFKVWRIADDADRRSSAWWNTLGAVLGAPGIAAMAVLAGLRLVGVEACASRTWTLSGGCLPPSVLTA